MNIKDIETGMQVRTASTLNNAFRSGVRTEYLDARKEGAIGTVVDWVPGFPEVKEVWYVKHSGKQGESIAAYRYSELNPV